MYELVSTGKASISRYSSPLPQPPSMPLLDKVKAAFTGSTQASSDAAASEPAAIAAATTIHCLGIGHGVHRSLLDGMSTRTGGVVHCVVDDEDIAAKCGALRRAATTGGRLSKPRLLAKGCLAKPAPGRLPQVRAWPGLACCCCCCCCWRSCGMKYWCGCRWCCGCCWVMLCRINVPACFLIPAPLLSQAFPSPGTCSRLH